MTIYKMCHSMAGRHEVAQDENYSPQVMFSHCGVGSELREHLVG